MDEKAVKKRAIHSIEFIWRADNFRVTSHKLVKYQQVSE